MFERRVQHSHAAFRWLDTLVTQLAGANGLEKGCPILLFTGRVRIGEIAHQHRTKRSRVGSDHGREAVIVGGQYSGLGTILGANSRRQQRRADKENRS